MSGGTALVRSVAALGRRYWLVWVIALGVFANGSLEIITGLDTDYHPGRITGALPFGLKEWNRASSVILGLTLLFLSFHLARRRRLAWWLAAGGLGLLTIFHIAGRHNALLAFGSAFMFALLLVARRRFTVRFDPGGIVRGLELAITTLVLAILWGTVAFYLLDERDFGREFSLADSFVRTLREFLLIGNSDLVPRTRGAVWFPRILGAFGIAAELLALFSLFRPVAYRIHTEPQERRRARGLLKRYGRSAYDFFKVWPDKSLFFAGPHSFVGYTVHHGVAVALGDPTGPPDELERAVQSFVKFARDNGWVAAFMMPEDVPVYRNLGLWLVKVGEEATVDLKHFREITAENKYFRRVTRQMEQLGTQFERSTPPHSKALLAEVERLSAAWMNQEHYREFGFVQGTLNRRYLQQTVLDLLRDKDGRLIAFINEVPSNRPGEMGFDMMRRLPEAHWSAMDYLFLKMMLALETEGFKILNFGLAPFAGVGEDPDSNLTEKTIRAVAPLTQRLVRSAGLTQYKKKFEPVWEDRYIVYDGGPLVLPQVALALTTVAA